MENLIIKENTVTKSEVEATETQTAPSILIAPPSTTAGVQATPTPSTAPAPSTALPDGYLADGTMLDDDGILRPEYLKEYAQQVAELLRPMKASAFHKAFMKEPKKFQKPKVSDGAKKLCANGLAVEARTLVGLKKAPAVLLPLIEAATDTVQDADTFEALCRHLAAVYSYLL